MLIWIKYMGCQTAVLTRGSLEEKRQNEPNVSLGKMYRLSETRVRAAIACAKSQNDPNVNLSRLYGLRRLVRTWWIVPENGGGSTGAFLILTLTIGAP